MLGVTPALGSRLQPCADAHRKGVVSAPEVGFPVVMCETWIKLLALASPRVMPDISGLDQQRGTLSKKIFFKLTLSSVYKI